MRPGIYKWVSPVDQIRRLATPAIKLESAKDVLQSIDVRSDLSPQTLRYAHWEWAITLNVFVWSVRSAQLRKQFIASLQGTWLRIGRSANQAERVHRADVRAWVLHLNSPECRSVVRVVILPEGMAKQ